MSHDELAALCGAYAMGALDGEELSRFHEHLPACWDCRRRVMEYDEIYAEGTQVLSPVAPSPQVRERLLARASGTSRALSGGAGAAPAGARRPPLVALLLALLGLALLALGLALGKIRTLQAERDALQQRLAPAGGGER